MPIRRSGALSPREFVTVGDPASACWTGGDFGLRRVLTAEAGIRDRIRRLRVGLETAWQGSTECDSSCASRSVSGSVALWQADSGPAIT
jgi:hypothetical protein